MGSGNAEEHLTEGKQLAESLSRRLAAYALAATATAGIGLAGAAAPAEGAIITHSSSLTVSCIPVHIGGSFFSCHSEGTLNVVDAIDLRFNEFHYFVGSFGSVERFTSLKVLGKGVGVAVSSAPGAARFGKGTPIGPADSFIPGSSLLMAFLHHRPVGNWWLSGRGYLGFEFSSHGKHFGWVAASVSDRGSGAIFGLNVTGYAYDTVAGQTIKAGQTSPVPEPTTLSLLALGAVGLFALRKRKLSAVSDQ